MSTVPCRKCGNPVDHDAVICPKCSAVHPAQRAPETSAGVRVQPAGPGRVVIAGVDIPFGELVMLMIKVVLASIPAYIILMAISFFMFAVFGVMLGLAGIAVGR